MAEGLLISNKYLVTVTRTSTIGGLLKDQVCNAVINCNYCNLNMKSSDVFNEQHITYLICDPDKEDLKVIEPLDMIKNGDVIQLVHGMTHRALNSHDVAAAMSPQNQEVTCYIDYNISMSAENLWRVDITNQDENDNVWHSIGSQVRLIHVNSEQALRYSGKVYADWGFHQNEVVCDKQIAQLDTIWNVEEHR